jgi:hypothetical protein
MGDGRSMLGAHAVLGAMTWRLRSDIIGGANNSPNGGGAWGRHHTPPQPGRPGPATGPAWGFSCCWGYIWGLGSVRTARGMAKALLFRYLS